MTKTQAKKQVKELLTKLWKISDELRELQDYEIDELTSEVDNTRDEIEPYENRDELTEQQEERLEWFDNLYDLLENVRDLDIEDTIGELDDFINE